MVGVVEVEGWWRWMVDGGGWEVDGWMVGMVEVDGWMVVGRKCNQI